MHIYEEYSALRGNGTPSLCDVLRKKDNNFTFITRVSMKLDNFNLEDRLAIRGSRVRILHLFYFVSLKSSFLH